MNHWKEKFDRLKLDFFFLSAQSHTQHLMPTTYWLKLVMSTKTDETKINELIHQSTW